MSFVRGDFVTIRGSGYGRVCAVVHGGNQYVVQHIDAPNVLERHEENELTAHTPPAGNYGLPALDPHYSGAR